MNKYLDIDYLKSLENKPYYFGLGFIQLKINKSQRIHFWHSELIKTAGDEEIHDHVLMIQKMNQNSLKMLI